MRVSDHSDALLWDFLKKNKRYERRAVNHMASFLTRGVNSLATRRCRKILELL